MDTNIQPLNPHSHIPTQTNRADLELKRHCAPGEFGELRWQALSNRSKTNLLSKAMKLLKK